MRRLDRILDFNDLRLIHSHTEEFSVVKTQLIFSRFTLFYVGGDKALKLSGGHSVFLQSLTLTA